MAYYGLSKPYIAKFDPATKKYSDGFRCGKAVGTDITPNYNTAVLHGDNEPVESVDEFKDADVNLNVTTMPIEASDVVFGHEVDAEKKEIKYKDTDSANFVGYGFCVNEMINNVKLCVAAVLPKVKFKEAAESYTTKGDSIEFKSPSITGKAYPGPDGLWKEKKVFDTEKEACAWIKEKLEITETENTEGTENTESTDETETTT